MSFQEYAQSARSRFRLGDVSPKLAIGVIAIVAVVMTVAVVGAIAVLSGGVAEDPSVSAGFSISEAQADDANNAEGDALDARTEQKASLCVYISGCVVNPGVFYLEEGSRVADAIGAAGGMSADAAADSLNLARLLVDGEQIDVMSEDEAKELLEGSSSASGMSSQSGTGQGAVVPSANSGRVNINTATAQELQTIKGIGESKAAKIIAYRESNGPFSSVDDLTNVSGIGDKTLESIRDSICV